jgi:transposase
MPRYKDIDTSQGFFLPVSIEAQLIPGSFEYALNTVIDEKVDLSVFDTLYDNDLNGAKAIPPSALLKLILFCYSKGIVSSRRIEETAHTNIVCMALTGGLEPDHSTIAAFVSSMGDQITPIFRDVLLYLYSLDLVSQKMFAVDGIKLPSNAAKEWSGTFAELKNKRDKCARIAKLLVSKQRELDKSDKEGRADLTRRKKKYERTVSKIDQFLATEKKREGTQGTEIKSNITDNESAKMMTSKGVIQGYNGIAVVDSEHQVIVAAEAFGSGQEHELFAPVIEQAEETMSWITGEETPLSDTVVLADTGYFTESNLKLCEDKHIDAYIPDPKFRQRDERFANRDESHRPERLAAKLYDQADFIFNTSDNSYTCPAGKRLRIKNRSVKINGFIGRRYIAQESDCAACETKKHCIRNGGKGKSRTLFIATDRLPGNERTLSREMMQKIDTDEAKDMYSHRMGIVEPVFANIRSAKKMNYLTLRSKVKVNIQWLLFCIVHNIEKARGYNPQYA